MGHYKEAERGDNAESAGEHEVLEEEQKPQDVHGYLEVSSNNFNEV